MPSASTAPAFPDGFVWGAATSAYQIEGGVRADGRGPSIWDVFGRRPGAIADGDTGDMACDHYHRFRSDVALMKDLGLQSYRFSVAWPRVQPDGSGDVNAAGLDFYERLVDELLAAGIAPTATLYHWDLPQRLEDAGGWTNRTTAYRFAEYAAVVYDRLGDRIDTWITINEPWVAAVMGYGLGVHAPGRSSPMDAAQASHHMLLAHGFGTQALRQAGADNVTITLNLSPVVTAEQLPDLDSEPSGADAEAVERIDALLNRQFLDPVLRGTYPHEVLSALDRTTGLQHIRDDDLDLIRQPLDVLGVNYYHPCVVRAAAGEPANPAYPGSDGIRFDEAHGPSTAVGWPIVPAGLTRLLTRLTHDYPGVGLVVTENGAAFHDVTVDGRVRDTDRTEFVDAHLRAALDAVQAGADLRGYQVWTLLDNFEWAEGYGPRFGIVHVDRTTQRRILKDSALWYRDVIRANALPAQRSRRPTLEEVGARAGVSRSTVSRVINGDMSVNEQTRDHVLAVVRQLGYVPNSAARSLVTRRADTIALVVPDSGAEPSDDPVTGTIIRTVGRAVETAGKHLVVMQPRSLADGRRAQAYVAAGHVDGIVLVPTSGDDPFGSDPQLPVPMVTLGRLTDRPAMPFVATDERGGAAAAVTHLIELGRRRIAMITGPQDAHGLLDRQAGYEETVRAAGRPIHLVESDLSYASGMAAAAQLLTHLPDVDAIFAAGDVVAIGAIRSLIDAGRRVPADVAVVGFGDIGPASYTVPPLTTVRTGTVEAAGAAVDLLLRRIDGHAVTSTLLPAELVVRASTVTDRS